MLTHIITAAFVALLLAAALSDVRTRRIPNVLTVSGLVVGLTLRSFLGVDAVLSGLAGAGLALAIGVVLMAIGGFGGGDAKLMMAVGAFTGPKLFLLVFVLTALIGGAMAIAEAVWRGSFRELLRNTANLAKNLATAGRSGTRQTLETQRAAKLPYGVAIALGSLAGWILQ